MAVYRAHLELIQNETSSPRLRVSFNSLLALSYAPLSPKLLLPVQLRTEAFVPVNSKASLMPLGMECSHVCNFIHQGETATNPRARQ